MATMTQSSRKTLKTLQVILGSLFLLCGCVIYLLFRSTSLNIYQWCSAIGLSSTIDAMRVYTQTWYIPHIVRYCLPDGLYCTAYLLMMDAVWKEDKSLLKYAILSIVPIVTISSELLQYVGLVPGTFDIYDLLCYSMPPAIYIIYNRKDLCSTFNIQQL